MSNLCKTSFLTVTRLPTWPAKVAVSTGSKCSQTLKCASSQDSRRHASSAATHNGMIGLLTSLAYYLGSYGVHITFGSAAFLIGFMSVTQMYTLAYRYAVLNQDSEISEKFLRKITIAGFFVVAMAIGLFYAWCMFNTLESPQRVEALLNTPPRGNISNREIIEWKTSFWKQWIWPMNELVFMIDLDKSAPYFLAKAVVVGLGIFAVVCAILIFLVFYKMRRNASNYSAQTIQMHKRLTQLLIVQVEFKRTYLQFGIFSLWFHLKDFVAGPNFNQSRITMPITLVLIPAAITLVALQFSLEMGEFSYMYRNFIIVLYSPFNCIITFLFITPYRKYMKGLIARLLHIRPKVIEVTPVNSTNTVITVVQSA
ncbi:serpentine type 7TM GPCR chemoreceptor srh domain-containing protein [Ditylenchus destructor]|nr:serpentine type 7TM GPCR chemoreceptor srh domain-containing protein [Ditylenchus destructor]